jgi:hypothetical protein
VPALAATVPAYADGIIPDPPVCGPGRASDAHLQLAIEYHRWTSPEDRSPSPTDQVFLQRNDWTVEGTYIFLLPPDWR